MLKLILIFIVNLAIFKFLGLIPGIIGLAVLIKQLLDFLGFTRQIKFSSLSLADGYMYLKDYEGSYKDVGKYLEEAMNIIKKFRKEQSYILCGIYLDCPDKVQPPKQRMRIGIYKKKGNNKTFKEDEDVFEYVTNNGYKKVTVPCTKSAYVSWDYKNKFALYQGIQKFYKALHTQLQSANFRNSYKLGNDISDIFSIELYPKKDQICFYIPNGNREAFLENSSFKK